MYWNPFRCRVPQLVGIGVRNQLGSKLKEEFGCKKVMVMYDKGVADCGIADKIIDLIKAEGIEYVVYDKVQPDPPDHVVDDAAAFGRDNGIDGIVAVGGGAVLDTAKAAKLLQSNPGTARDWMDDSTTPRKDIVPLIVIPTTSGTGTEATNGGIITDTSSGRKRAIGGDGCRANLGLVDPELMVSCPPKLTAGCGFDALAHIVSSMTNKKTSAVTQAVGREGIRLFMKSIHEAVFNGSNVQARMDIAMVANLGGIMISNTGCSLEHALAHAMGNVFHIPHGVSCAVTLPVSFELIAEVRKDEVLMIADCLGVNYEYGEDFKVIGKRISNFLTALADGLKVPKMADLIPSKEDAYKLIPFAIKDLNAAFSPIELNEENVKWYIDRLYER